MGRDEEVFACMESGKEFEVYSDIGKRTNGEIYIGVVGPVRTGKSTFIKRFMDLCVLPNVSEEYEKKQNPSYRVFKSQSELITLLQDNGVSFISESQSDFYSDGLRFATTTEFS